VESDLAEADRTFRVAFGTFMGAPDPESFFGDADYIRTRWRAAPEAALAAEAEGHLVGSNFATNWGSVGFFGPLTVEPLLWGHGVAQALLAPTMDLFARWGTRSTGLFTFANSPKHVSLYQKFGFWPRFLTAIMSAQVRQPASRQGSRLSELPDRDRPAALEAAREVTGAVYEGLDVTREIEAVQDQRLGDTVLLEDGTGLQGIAVCHLGAGTEAGGGACYVKFGAVRPGPQAERHFSRLLDACQGLAADHGASVLTAGANAARSRAWRALLDHDFRAGLQGVAMQRPNEAGYNTEDTFVIDDWR
jgi:GNAT superfamily N-acetyltransferase